MVRFDYKHMPSNKRHLYSYKTLKNSNKICKISHQIFSTYLTYVNLF